MEALLALVIHRAVIFKGGRCVALEVLRKAREILAAAGAESPA